MKKALVCLLIMVFAFGGSINALAYTWYKDVNVELSASAESVNVGDTVTFTAVVPKHGSSYVDKWEGAVLNNTVFDDTTAQYVSKATFTPDKPGTYTITYTIYMQSGGSDTEFAGVATKTIEVTGAATVAGLVARTADVEPYTLSDGSIIGYAVVAQIYVLWSDGSLTPYCATSLFLGPDETSSTFDMTIMIDGVEYIYPVTVTI